MSNRGSRVQPKEDLNQTVADGGADDPAEVVRMAIEREFDDLRRAVEALIWKKGLAARREGVSDVAEEVLQEVASRALAGAQSYDPARSAHAWLFGIAVNVVRERYRSSRQEQMHRADPVREADADDEADSEEVFARVANLAWREPERLVELLELVEPPDRALLHMRYVDDLKGRELAAKLGITEGAARVRLSRVLDRLGEAYRHAEQTGHEDH